MSETIKRKFDLSKRRRLYFSEYVGLTYCPECNSLLIEDSCTVVISAKSDTDKGKFMSNAIDPRFCEKCPIIILDSEKTEMAVRLGLRGDNNAIFKVEGIVYFEAIPKEKRNLELGIDGNPIPLVDFLPPLSIAVEKKLGRNDLCPCKSGLKYKKCCGK